MRGQPRDRGMVGRLACGRSMGSDRAVRVGAASLLAGAQELGRAGVAEIDPRLLQPAICHPAVARYHERALKSTTPRAGDPQTDIYTSSTKSLTWTLVKLAKLVVRLVNVEGSRPRVPR